MIVLKVDKLLKDQNKTPYWLSKQTGISQNNIAKICNGETSTIRFETIEKICNALNCNVEDIFQYNNTELKSVINKDDTE